MLFHCIEQENTRSGSQEIHIEAEGQLIGRICLEANGRGSVSCKVGEGRFEYLDQCKSLAEGKKILANWYEKNRDAVKQANCKPQFLPSGDNTEFFPTPDHLAGKMLAKVNWKLGVKTVLEPEAGKGDLVQAFQRFQEKRGYSRDADDAAAKVDVIERDENLRHILKGKELRVVGDDFLSFTSFKNYGLILMNPPFSDADAHLLHALEMQKNGGQIVCLLNAETIRNQCTARRKILSQMLMRYNASIEFVEGAFLHAERPSDVEVAIVYVSIPQRQWKSAIFASLEKAEKRKEEDEEQTELAPNNWAEHMIRAFDVEAKAGIALLREYSAVQPKIMTGSASYQKPMISMKIGDHDVCDSWCDLSAAVNLFMEKLRYKYWALLLRRPELTEKMTSQMQSDYSSKIDSLADYDFNEYNIRQVMLEISSQLTDGIKDSILKLFDEFSAAHSWYSECSGNIHYYNGWATNKAHMVNSKKVILPISGAYADTWHHEKLDSYRICRTISDLERALNYLDRGETSCFTDVAMAVQRANNLDTNKVEFTFFDVTFYKKGTAHIKFKPTAARIIERLNIYAGQQRAWLPPCYGKKKYADMTAEEKTVIDEFQGEEAYNELMKDPSLYLTTTLQMLPSASMTEDKFSA